jgi:predicted esterase
MKGPGSSGDEGNTLHQAEPIRRLGPPPGAARAAVVMVHGRGADADDILGLAAHLEADGVAFLAPQAARNTWYPYSFLAPLEQNEPWLSSALARVEDAVALLAGEGLGSERVMLLGFSQGACLTVESVVRAPRRYGAVVGLTGGLIGPDGTARPQSGDLGGTPVYLGASAPDPHVPWARVEETADVLRRLGGVVETEPFHGFPHAVHPRQLATARRLLDDMLARPE